MANRSSLELMLEKIQQREDKPKDIPPALPARPVSRARLPRTRRPPQLDLRRRNSEEPNDGSFNGSCVERKRNQQDGSEIVPGQFEQFQKGTETMENPKQKSENGIQVIQKCYRGHRVRHHYKQLRRGALALQSFIQGQNARRNYEYRRTRIRAILVIQKHVRKYITRRALEQRRAAYLEPRTKVPYDVLVDLQRQVLGSEAKAREKKEENIALKVRIQEMDKKWKQYEERMKSMEKMWQDQLMQIQKSLVAAKTHLPPKIKFKHYGPSQPWKETYVYNGGMLDLPINATRRRGDRRDEDIDLVEVGLEDEHKLHPQEELCRLKNRFEAWKREYKSKLRDAQSTFRKLGNSETVKSQKNWWGRLS